MRLSNGRHTLAILRLTIGYTQKEMAELIGRKTPTVQAIENCKLKLSEKLGELIAAKTGVSLAWLLKNDVTAPIIDKEGGPYTTHIFRGWNAALTCPRAEFWDLPQFNRQLGTQWVLMMALFWGAYRQDRLPLFFYKLTEAIESLSPEIQIDEEFYQAALKFVDEKPPGKDLAKLFYDYSVEQLRAKIKQHPELDPRRNQNLRMLKNPILDVLKDLEPSPQKKPTKAKK